MRAYTTLQFEGGNIRNFEILETLGIFEIRGKISAVLLRVCENLGNRYQ